MRNILLVDFNNFWNRYFHALVRNKKSTEEINNFVVRIKEILYNLNNSDHYNKIFLILDGNKGNESKKLILESYKGNRDTNKGIVYDLQRIVLRDFVLPTMPNLQVLRADEYEADHIVAILAYNFANKGDQVDIFSSDKDLLQVLSYSPNIHIGYKMAYSTLVPLSMDEILKKFKGVSHVGEIVKFRTFRGDPSDNIPPAIPRLPSRLIFTLIREVWHSPVLTAPILEAFADFSPRIPRTSLPLIVRNWRLMYLPPTLPIPSLSLKRLKPNNNHV